MPQLNLRTMLYPRPVSPLCAEPAFFRSKDAIYESSSSDDDLDIRTTKRRRIEDLGEQYLRGEVLDIMTASLKGPLTNWKNPWIKKRKIQDSAVTTTPDRPLEVPETTAAPKPRLEFTSTVGQPVDLFGFRSTNSQLNESAKVRAQKSDRKVQDWLKRDTTCGKDKENTPQGSPTPIAGQENECKEVNLVEEPNKIAHENKKSEKPQVQQSGLNDIASPSERKQEVDRQPYLSPRPSDKNGDGQKAMHSVNSHRAEFAALRSKRRSLHTVPPLNNMSPFQYRRASEGYQERNNEAENVPCSAKAVGITAKPTGLHMSEEDEPNPRVVQLPSLSELDEMKMGDQVAPAEVSMNPPEPRRATFVLVPNLSTETSRSSTTNALPSAQVDGIQAPQMSTSASLHDDIMLEEPKKMLPEEDNVAGNAVASAHIPRPAIHKQAEAVPNEQEEPSFQKQQPKLVPWGKPVNYNADPQRLAKEPDTQTMLQAITPLTFSTVKKATSTTISKSSPMTVTRPKPKRKTDRPSSTADALTSSSSQISIKNNLKVSKSMSSPTEKPNHDSLSPFGRHGLDMETSVEDRSQGQEWPGPAQALSLLSLSGNKTVKSASKFPVPVATSPTGLLHTTSASTSVGMLQDAQVQKVSHHDSRGYRIPIDDDAFDLRAAIDDLGSYLGTWDADKEAQSLMSSA